MIASSRIAAATLLLLPATVQGSDDPRLLLVQLQLAGRPELALERTEEMLERDAESAGSLGLLLLHGHLLEEVGRQREACDAFATGMAASPDLAPYYRYRLARNQELRGHPEVAAGLVATLLGRDVPQPLAADASRLLLRSLAAGGDCRLVGQSDGWKLPAAERRLVRFARADCEEDRAATLEALATLLDDELGDLAARLAAERLSRLVPATGEPPVDVARLLGLAFHHQRRFELAIPYLEAVLDAEDPATPLSERGAEALYALARTHFWRTEHALAARLFHDLGERLPPGRDRARAFYQAGRARELDGDWEGATSAFDRAFAAEPDGDWAGAALLSRLRLHFRSGDEAGALRLLDALGDSRRWGGHRRRGELFLATSDLVRGRLDRAAAWLAPSTVPADEAVERSYWRGRLALAGGRTEEAIDHLLAAAAEEPLHPLALAARERLLAPPLAPVARRRATGLAGSSRLPDLLRAWAVLGDGPAGEALAGRITRAAAAATSAARPFLAFEPVPPEEWPLWRAPLRRAEEQLLALGLWNGGAPAVLRHFPVSEPALAATGARLLQGAGDIRGSLYVAEILLKRLPEELPLAFVDPDLRRLVYPLPWRREILTEARRQGVDPAVLAAVIREESRFDPQAVSAASAYGLAQFVLPTARRLAREIGLGEVTAEELMQPELSIAMGAAYLGELGGAYAAGTPMVLAAYNAGEAQAELWLSYTYSHQPDEYYSKIGFTETRHYVRKVMGSAVQYREVYGEGLADGAHSEPSPRSGGSSE